MCLLTSCTCAHIWCWDAHLSVFAHPLAFCLAIYFILAWRYLIITELYLLGVLPANTYLLRLRTKNVPSWYHVLQIRMQVFSSCYWSDQEYVGLWHRLERGKQNANSEKKPMGQPRILESTLKSGTRTGLKITKKSMLTGNSGSIERIWPCPLETLQPPNTSEQILTENYTGQYDCEFALGSYRYKSVLK